MLETFSEIHISEKGKNEKEKQILDKLNAFCKLTETEKKNENCQKLVKPTIFEKL